MAPESCVLCRAQAADPDLLPVEAWRDELWRLTAALVAEVPGFCYLEPRRHVPHIDDLDGPEAASLGAVLARVTRALKEATGAELVYVYVYVFGGGVAHLHLHLAPHSAGDALNDHMVRGPLVERRLASGLTEFVSEEFPPLPEAVQQATAARVRELLAG
jgi:diadenosine tetraphosphate (Ap4A) HIT family hydrolase